MKSISQKIVLCSLIMVMAFSMVACNLGQAEAAYPEKPITNLIGFKAGGGSDALAQLTEPYLSKYLNQSFINVYRPGATGAIAWTELSKKTKNDGYTISITNTPMLMTNYIMNSQITYNIKELDPLANVVTDPGILLVGKDSKFKSAKEFFDYAKANPGKVTVGNSGIGGDDFFSCLLLEKASGLKFQMVPFQGDGPSWQAAMGGKIDASSNNLGITFPQIKAGNLVPLAVYMNERHPMLPDVPTLKELGIDVVAGSSRGYSAPKGIPTEAKEVLIEAFKKMAQDEEFIKVCNDRAMTLDFKFGEDYWNYLQEQETRFQGVWDEVKDQYTKK